MQMKKKLKCIMLIDDNPNDNFFHERIISRVNCADSILIKETALEALSCIEKGEARPELIFLDVNMPAMTGWEFLEAYNGLEADLHCRVVVVMLTSSTETEDRQKAAEMDIVADFQTKPLTKPKLQEVLGRHFPDYF